MSAEPVLTQRPAGPFSLAASIRFLEGFTPRRTATATACRLAFPVAGD